MTETLRPRIEFLGPGAVEGIVDAAKLVLEEIGVLVEHDAAVELLAGAGATAGANGRVQIGADLVDKCLQSVPAAVSIYDRDGLNEITLGGDAVHFDPGSAAIKVFDHDSGAARPANQDDCATFARLAENLSAMSLQSTCVVPDDVPLASADRVRLYHALRHCRKGVVTGTFAGESFEIMRRMLVVVRGSESALREHPLAIFDCCPSPPLEWSELTCSVLVRCAQEGIPAQLVSMPLTGATAPVTLSGAIVQHTAENLSGIAIHQLARTGAPIIYGGSPSAFDMRHGTTPMGAVETMMIDCSYAQVGKHLGLPTHAYMGLSDSKAADYQAGMESATGAMLAALAGINLVSGAGMLDFESCQSLEKLVLDNEACHMAIRAIQGVAGADIDSAVDVIRDGIESGQFLNLDHTRQRYRSEHRFPGNVVDRVVGETWASQGSRSAAERAHEEVVRLLEVEPAPPLADKIEGELKSLAMA